MKIARNVAASGRHDEWHPPLPAPSLRELSSESETEGVSPNGSSTPTIYTPAHMNSETFERLRATNDTPSVTPDGRASSLREGAGKRSHSTGYSLNRRGGGRFSSPLRNSKVFTFRHSSGFSLTSGGGGRFSSPRKTQKILGFTIRWSGLLWETCGFVYLRQKFWQNAKK